MFQFQDNPLRAWDCRVAAMQAELTALDVDRAVASSHVANSTASLDCIQSAVREIDALVDHARKAIESLYLEVAWTPVGREA